MLEFSNKIVKNISNVIKGKENQIKIIISALFSGGHVLLEDVPGVGKTMLARAISKSFFFDFKRVQFTPDLLPTDLTGLYIYKKEKNEFIFKEGPIFTNVLLADEINRATPRTQSALLESMAEKQVTVDGVTHILPDVFFVIATQNPIESEGTFPLPEAQLDRFMVKLSMGYPNEMEEKEILLSQLDHHPIEDISAVMDMNEFLEHRKKIKKVKISEDVIDYIVDIVRTTRNHKDILVGASPRGSIALMKLSKSYAYLNGRDFVLPDDVKTLAPFVLNHRILLNIEAKIKKVNKFDIINEVLDFVKVVK
ncbi:magnesium chelatase [Thermosipho melanesiensis]|uniref:ATPase associated with various cellular activities, AAA_3 n=2 Tax=Thermosipho melanesiensis TaxID=46541 RepID=A6LLK1_THEM4|nr:MoxR family ATPase [Thermosipho melanesiensis]ABR30802.1 ATPase associated with various cellular activities, AAA_3 [Thermosipho melanesiensis BI429]APT73922.1 magnesium chelatase [Thermosipho melanesiensis]OOC35860.1 magnesium chelatase [Thermosipho melanesiensis]OOC38362.1 magnesium chelatase [Thermosipho melanesiensis]OOC38823.1 magnesium chelatase [Thermosipho melanesiensis]